MRINDLILILQDAKIKYDNIPLLINGVNYDIANVTKVHNESLDPELTGDFLSLNLIKY